MSFDGKVAIVIGAAGGIGYAIARQLLEKNISKLALLDIQEGEELVQKLKDEYGQRNIRFFKVDITDKPQLEKTMQDVIKQFSSLDILINAGGIFNDQDAQKTLTVNGVGVINTSLAALEHMSKEKKGHGGVVINVSSVVGLEPFFLLPVYTASKHAVTGFTRCLSNDYYFLRTGVKFIMICPGATMTNLFENLPNKMILPDEEEALKYFSILPKQSPNDLAENIIRALENGENGAIWLCDDKKMERVTPTKYWGPSP